jgi:hypothetical protein
MIELDESTRRLMARRYPQLVGRGPMFVLSATLEIGRLNEALRQLVHDTNEGRHARIEDLVESLLPPVDVPPPRDIEQARRAALLRIRILRDFGAMTAAELAALAGSRAANRSQLAYRWRNQRRIFAVPHRRQLLYPSFQFGADGRPLPVLRSILAALVDWAPWDIAAWFVMANPWLDQARPVELLQDAAAAVVEAARAAAGRLRAQALPATADTHA